MNPLLTLLVVIACFFATVFFRALTAQHVLEFGLPMLNMQAVHFTLWQSFWFSVVLSGLSGHSMTKYVEDEKYNDPMLKSAASALTAIIVYGAVYAIV